MYTFTGRVRYSETDQNGFLSLEGVMDYLQDCSTFQSEDLGIGIAYMQERNVAWLVNYWQIDIYALPRLGDPIVIGTSPYALKGFMGLRNFMIESPEGQRLVEANSVWSFMNMDRMMPERVPEIMEEKYVLAPRFDMEYTPRKIAVPEDGGTTREAVHVTETMLDSNHHVNNVQYVRLAAAYLDPNEKILRLRAEYKNQARLGDKITPVVYTRGNTRTIALNADDGRPYSIIEFSAAQ